VKKFDATSVKGINHDKDQDGIFDQYDSFPEDNTKAFRNRVPYKGYINHVFEENWPKTDDFDYNDFVSSTVYYLTKDANGSLSMIDYEITIHENGGSGENGFGLQILSLGKLNSGNLTDLSQINEDLIILNDEGGQIRNDNDAPGSIIIVDANQTAENIPQEIAFSVDLSKLDYKVELGIYSDFFLFNKKNRGLEIHGPTGRPTQAMDKAFLNTMDDASNPAYDQFFRTAGNLPWALEIWNDESISPAYYDMVDGLNLMEIYPAVKNWIETDGIENKDWHNDLVTGKIKNL